MAEEDRFERYTDQARRVVVLAQEAARELKHNYIGTEHLLLGLRAEENGLAARVLSHFGVGLQAVQEQILRIVGQGQELVDGPVPFTPRAKKVLELSLREALSLGHNYIGTEHILLGLVRENEGVAYHILRDAGADAEKVRGEIIRMLSGTGRQRPVPPQILQVKPATTLRPKEMEAATYQRGWNDGYEAGLKESQRQ